MSQIDRTYRTLLNFYITTNNLNIRKFGLHKLCLLILRSISEFKRFMSFNLNLFTYTYSVRKGLFILKRPEFIKILIMFIMNILLIICKGFI